MSLFIISRHPSRQLRRTWLVVSLLPIGVELMVSSERRRVVALRVHIRQVPEYSMTDLIGVCATGIRAGV
jgi:hypothetical protein